MKKLTILIQNAKKNTALMAGRTGTIEGAIDQWNEICRGAGRADLILNVWELPRSRKEMRAKFFDIYFNLIKQSHEEAEARIIESEHEEALAMDATYNAIIADRNATLELSRMLGRGLLKGSEK